MIDFEKEIEKFTKSAEIEDIKDLIADTELTDMNDLMFKMMKEGIKNGGKF